MPTPASIDAWLANGHENADLLVHHDRYFVPEDPAGPVADLFDSLLDRLPREERLAVNTVVMKGMSYRDAAIELDMWLSSGKPNKKRVYRLVERAIESLRADVARRAPWLGAFVTDPSLLLGMGPVQGEIVL